MQENKQVRTRRPAVIIYDSRCSANIGIKLAVLSVRAQMPEAEVRVSVNGTQRDLRDWLNGRPGVTVLQFDQALGSSFNVKPALMLQALDCGFDDVVWFDSDIIWNNALDNPLCEHDEEVFVATDETYWGQRHGSRERTLNWGLTVGRELPRTLNSGIVRATSKHRPLLESWLCMLRHPLYKEAQTLPWYDRPIHMLGDQDVLTALLGSMAFRDVPLVTLKRGRDIAQCFGPAGFTPAERLIALWRGEPALVHAMGPIKPWNRDTELLAVGRGLSSLRSRYRHAELDVAPYLTVARRFADQIDEDMTWVHPTSWFGHVMQLLVGNSLSLKGLPLALFDGTIRLARRSLGVSRLKFDPYFRLDCSPIEGVLGEHSSQRQ